MGMVVDISREKQVYKQYKIEGNSGGHNLGNIRYKNYKKQPAIIVDISMVTLGTYTTRNRGQQGRVILAKQTTRTRGQQWWTY